jgi:DNA-binding NarL/FixJ family response regulator
VLDLSGSVLPDLGLSRKGTRMATRIRVLLADDSVIMRQCLADFLGGFSDVEIAGEAINGKMAVEMTKQLVPDVVIMDINMPVMNGIEATRAIHHSLPQVSVVGLSMADDADCRDAMTQAGAADFVSKLKFSDLLIAAIRTCFLAGHAEVAITQ